MSETKAQLAERLVAAWDAMERWKAEALAARAATKQFLYWDGTKFIPFRGFVSGEEEEKYSAARAAGVTGVTIGYVEECDEMEAAWRAAASLAEKQVGIAAEVRKERNAWKAEAMAARALLSHGGYKEPVELLPEWMPYREAYAHAREANGEE